VIGRRGLVLTALCLAVSATPAAAQKRDLIVRVRVTDTLGAPMASAEVSIHRGLAAITSGLTDSTGWRSLRVRGDDGEYDVSTRRIGFIRADRVFTASTRDPIAFAIGSHTARCE
jgi:hypothetical protein